MLVIVHGLASGKKTKIAYTLNEQKTILDYLREHNIAIASSCYGEGVCRKCIVGNELLSCQITMAECSKHFALEGDSPIIPISYL